MNFDVPPRANHTCYKYKHILFLPHYEIPGLFVAPSNRSDTGRTKAYYERRTYYKHELVKMGAVKVKEQLWTTEARKENELVA